MNSATIQQREGGSGVKHTKSRTRMSKKIDFFMTRITKTFKPVRWQPTVHQRCNMILSFFLRQQYASETIPAHKRVGKNRRKRWSKPISTIYAPGRLAWNFNLQSHSSRKEADRVTWKHVFAMNGNGLAGTSGTPVSSSESRRARARPESGRYVL